MQLSSLPEGKYLYPSHYVIIFMTSIIVSLFRGFVENAGLAVKEEYKKVETLENEIEALLLDSILSEQNIPHLIISYHDTAYDGLYQTQKGWGYISAPFAYLEEIKEIISYLRRGSNPNDIS